MNIVLDMDSFMEWYARVEFCSERWSRNNDYFDLSIHELNGDENTKATLYYLWYEYGKHARFNLCWAGKRITLLVTNRLDDKARFRFVGSEENLVEARLLGLI